MPNDPHGPSGPRAEPGRPIRAVAGALAVTALDAMLLVLALGGVQPLLEHARALSLLAVWLVGGIVLALLRPVRLHAPEAIRRESPIVLIALLVVPIVAPAIGALGERLGWFPLLDHPLVEWTGVGLTAAGLGVRIAAMAQLGSRFSPLVTVQRGHVLETRGIYAWVRHPGYLGALLACTGAMLAFGSALPLPLVLLFAGLLMTRIAREEVLLEQHFGDEFRRYRDRTGGLLPRPGGTADA